MMSPANKIAGLIAFMRPVLFTVDLSNILIFVRNHRAMTYPFVPIGLIAVFIVYILYLLLIKKDRKLFKSVFFLGLFFIAVWVIIYFFLLK